MALNEFEELEYTHQTRKSSRRILITGTRRSAQTGSEATTGGLHKKGEKRDKHLMKGFFLILRSVATCCQLLLLGSTDYGKCELWEEKKGVDTE